MEDFEPLKLAISRVFPGSRLEPVTDLDLATIRRQHLGVPEHYLAFLREVGYGSLGPGNFMIYSGLCEPDEIFDPATAVSLDGILFFGDNFARWMVGFDTRKDWQLIGVDSSFLEPYPEKASTIGEFVTQRIADQETV